jgi:uncharacterized protein YjiS (DUF1127 family)
MRQLTLMLAASTLILALTSLYLYRQLSAARALARKDDAHERSLGDQVARLEDIRDGLETDLRAARSAPSREAPMPAQPIQAAPPRAAESWGTPNWRPSARSREQLRIMTRHQYKRVFRELGLSESEMEAASDVLEQQAERSRKLIGRDGSENPAPPNDPQRDQAELAGVLGQDKAERFMAQKKLMPARSQLSLLRSQLEEGGEPLSAEQQQALLGKLSEREPPQFPRNVPGEDPSARFQAFMRDRDRGLRDVAAPVLTPKQRELMEEESKFQDATRSQISFAGPMPPSLAPAPQAGSSAPARTP